MTFSFKWRESGRYFFIIFLSECMVDLKLCYVQKL